MDIEHCRLSLSCFSARSESHEQDGEALARFAAKQKAAASCDPAMAFRTLPGPKADPYRNLARITGNDLAAGPNRRVAPCNAPRSTARSSMPCAG
jgi:hypothetical protein